MLQYSAEEQKQIQEHNKGKGSSSQNVLRNIDQPDESDEFPRWYTDVIISRSNHYELLMLQSQSLALQHKKEVVTPTPSGCSVSDVIKLLKNNKGVKQQIQQISFNINAYNNRQTVAGNPSFVAMQRNDGDQGRKAGYRLSNNLKMSDVSMSNSYFASHDQNSYNLYCINIRALNRLTYPELAVRKLSKFDDLFQIEEGNR